MSRRDRRVAAGALLAAACLVFVAGLLFVLAGGVDVAADRPHSWLTSEVLHGVFGRSLAVRAGSIEAPPDLDSPSRAALGAQHFHLVCANCHGGPGIGQSPVALSMTPRPQSLPAVVGQFSDAELFWIVKHGVKFSAMPSWTSDSRDDEVWSMVAFLKQLPKMTPEAYLAETAVEPGRASAPAIAFGDTVNARPADMRRNTFPENEYLYSVPAAAFGDQSIAGDALAICSRCHGADGTGAATQGEAPDLTLQSEDYLRAALRAYATGERRSGFMQHVAAQLSDSQIDAISRYYASLPTAPSQAVPGDAARAEAGRIVATRGLPDRAVPGCVSCHESAGTKVTGAPALSGQSALYLTRQLQAMREENRGSARYWNPMSAVARHLSDENIAAVAAYYAGRPPAKGAPAAAADAASAPQPAADRAAGEKKFAEVCSKCHAPDASGDRDGNVPNLTLADAPYVDRALHAFRAGERANERMQLVATALKEEEIAALAAYVGGLKPSPSQSSPNAEAAQRGRTLAENGLPDRQLPACLGCHGAEAVSALPMISRLQGQDARYLKARLDYFASPEARDLSLLNPMPAVARHLTEEQRADLAAYFASLPPLEKAQ